MKKLYYNISYKIKSSIRKLFPWLVPIHCKLYSILNKNKSMEKRFSDIYDKCWWGNDETVSGIGSTIASNKTLITALPQVFNDYNIKSILDVPCGDFNYMKEIDLGGIDYIGGDIVDSLIKENNKKYKQENISFSKIDITSDALPKCDLVICKDLMIHLSIENISKAIAKIKESNSKYLLASTLLDKTSENKDIPDGYFREVNLFGEPFNFPEPILTIKSDNKGIPSCCALFEIDKIV